MRDLAVMIAGFVHNLRDTTITGNVVRAAAVDLAVSRHQHDLGRTARRVSGNHHAVVTGDVSHDGAARYAQLAIAGNRGD